MAVIGLTADGKKIVKYTGAGPASYSSGGFTVTINELSKVEEVLTAELPGYLVEATPTAGSNTITVKVYQFDYPATAAGPAVEVADGTDLSGLTLKLIVLGV